jgi:hypothetical protein
MAINKNHEFEELDGIKCGIIEKNVKPERVAFLKQLLEYNRFTVMVVPTPAPKAAAKPAAVEGEEAPVAPETFTIGVTDYTFNPTNAIYGRALKTPDGHIVTAAYWLQQESMSHDEVPYFDFKG